MKIANNIELKVKNSFSKDGFLLTPEQSLAMMIKTPRGSRVMRLDFGSEFYKLIDKEIDSIWILKAKKAILDCTRDDKGNLWDERVDIDRVDIRLIDNKVNIEVILK